ncbi:MAG: hypothetical protein AAB855_02350 [Patescibacteria group bacterium]
MKEHDRLSDEEFGFSAISLVMVLFFSIIIIGETIAVTMIVSQYDRDHLPTPADCTTPAP